MPAIELPTWPTERADASEARWRAMEKRKWTDGICATTDNASFATFADSTGMQVKVGAGDVLIEGIFAQLTAQTTLAIATAHGSLSRRDLVVLRLDKNSPATIELDILTGSPSSSPATPTLTNTGSITEIPVALVAVSPGVSTITAGSVSDLRLYSYPRRAEPVGIVKAYMGTVAPYGHLMLKGGIFNVSQYPVFAWEMFQLTTGTFTLPNATNRVIRGAGSDLLATGGSDSRTLTEANIPLIEPKVDGDGGNRIIVTGGGPEFGLVTGPGAQQVTMSDVDSLGNASPTAVDVKQAHLALNWIVTAY